MNNVVLFVSNILFGLAFICANQIPILSIISNRIAFVFGVVAIINIVAERKFKKLPVFFYMWLAFAIYGLSTCLWSRDFESSYISGMRMLYLSLVFGLSLMFVRKESHLTTLMRTICIGAGIVTVSTLWNYITGHPAGLAELGFWTTSSRYSMSGVNPNLASTLIAICVPIAWWFFFEYDKVDKTTRTLAGIFSLLAPIGLILTGSRGAVWASVFGYGYVLFTVIRSKHRMRSTLLAGMAVFAVVLMIGFFKSSGNISASLDRVFGSGMSLSSENVTSRFDYWSQGYQIFTEHPFFGVGIGASGLEAENVGAKLVSHNTMISVLADYGVAGFLPFLAAVLLSIRAAFRCPKMYRMMFLSSLAVMFTVLIKETFYGEPFVWVTLLLPVLAYSVLKSKSESAEETIEAEDTPSPRLTLTPASEASE